jgi:CheY-like chemotaxis protein
MPRVGGVEFLRRLRQDSATTAIAVAILSSGLIDKPFFENQDFKVLEFLEKPVDPVKLGELLKSAGL